MDRQSLQCRDVLINSQDLEHHKPSSQVIYQVMHQKITTTLDSVFVYRETTTASATSTYNSKGKTNYPKNADICLRAEAIKKENRSFPGARVYTYPKSVPSLKTVDVIQY
jgi:hypothetical protein